MRITRSGHAPRVRVAALGTVALVALAGIAASDSAAKSSTASAGPVAGVSVRVEGLTKTLLAPTAVTLTAGSVSKDGVAADSCSALSALGALQDATRGSWAGSWSKSYKSYLITAIEGVNYPLTADYYWAFWVNDKPASTGACGVNPTKGTSILFFPEYDGKSKSIVAPAVLGLSAPSSVLVGKPFTVTVSSYANANGKRAAAGGAHLVAGSASATTGAGGAGTLTLKTPGEVTIDVSAPHSVRDEATLCVHKPGALCAKS